MMEGERCDRRGREGARTQGGRGGGESNEQRTNTRGGVRTRGGRGSVGGHNEQQRTRGGVRGGRGAGNAGSSRPQALDELSVRWIEDLPAGTPLEQPMHPKGRRSWMPEPRQPAGPSSSNHPPSALYIDYICSPAQASPGVPFSPEFTAAGPSSAAGPLSSPMTRSFKDSEILLEAMGSEDESDESSDDEGQVIVARSRANKVEAEVEVIYDLPTVETYGTDQDTASHLPRDLFDFQWNSFPDSPISPGFEGAIFQH